MCRSEVTGHDDIYVKGDVMLVESFALLKIVTDRRCQEITISYQMQNR